MAAPFVQRTSIRRVGIYLSIDRKYNRNVLYMDRKPFVHDTR